MTTPKTSEPDRPAVREQSNPLQGRLSIAALACSALSLFVPFGVVLAVLGVVLAAVARRRGERRAKVALALAIAATAFGFLFPIFYASQMADF